MISYERTQSGVLEVHVRGKITQNDIDHVWSGLRADLPPEGKIRILEVIGDLDGIEPAALWKDLKLGLPMLDRVDRAAVVADQRWIGAITRIASGFTSAEIRVFTTEQIDDARRWLAAAA